MTRRKKQTWERTDTQAPRDVLVHVDSVGRVVAFGVSDRQREAIKRAGERAGERVMLYIRADVAAELARECLAQVTVHADHPLLRLIAELEGEP